MISEQETREALAAFIDGVLDGDAGTNVGPGLADAIMSRFAVTLKDETEWEYGRAKPGWPVPHVDVLSDTPGNVEYQREHGFTIFRRRKPGPWELVPEEAADA